MAIHKVHDKFFRRMMKDKRVAKEFFQQYLPSHIIEQMDFSTLKLCEDTFTDDCLVKREIDRLFSIRFSGGLAYIYFLLEHLTKPRRHAVLTLFRYSLEVMESKINPDSSEDLPIVFPILYYAGKYPFNYSIDFLDSFGENKELAREIFHNPFQLIDITQIEDKVLQEKLYAGALHLSLKYQYKQSREWAYEILFPKLIELDKTGAHALTVSAFKYLFEIDKVLDFEEIMIKFQHELSHETEERIMTLADRLRHEGRDEGRDEGRHEGRHEGHEQGIELEKKHIAIKLLKEGAEIPFILRITELTSEQLVELQKETVY